MTVEALGKDQWKWLNTYASIDLTHWRMGCFEEHGNVPDWYYVGEWKPGPIDPHPGSDGGYGDRSMNLKRDRFHYWPLQ